MTVPLLILGGNSRIGRAMRGQEPVFQQAGLAPTWQARRPDPGYLNWDILAEPCPEGAARGVVLCLAGVIHGPPETLRLNETLAMAACKAAADQGARHVFLASSAAVYSPSQGPLNEGAETQPPGAYGAAKLAMEQAALDWHQDSGPGLTILRIGNVAGFDALLGGHRAGAPVGLDPVDGQEGGPVRSYIGPTSLAVVLARLAGLAADGHSLPKLLNVAASPPISMANLLNTAEIDWQFRKPNPAVIARVELETALLRGLVDIPPAAGQAAAMVAEWQGLAK